MADKAMQARINGMKGGRPKGSTTKPRLSDYLSVEQVKKLVEKAHQMASEGNETMLKFVLEQHFGKAVQTVAGDAENPLNMQIVGMKIIKE